MLKSKIITFKENNSKTVTIILDYINSYSLNEHIRTDCQSYITLNINTLDGSKFEIRRDLTRVKFEINDLQYKQVTLKTGESWAFEQGKDSYALKADRYVEAKDIYHTYDILNKYFQERKQN